MHTFFGQQAVDGKVPWQKVCTALNHPAQNATRRGAGGDSRGHIVAMATKLEEATPWKNIKRILPLLPVMNVLFIVLTLIFF